VVNVVSIGAVAAVPVLPAYSVSKAASLSVTQSLRALLAGQGVSVYAVVPGPIDTDMARALDIPKTPPEDAARATLTAWRGGEEEIFPDPVSQLLADGWRAGVAKELERQNATTVEASRAPYNKDAAASPRAQWVPRSRGCEARNQVGVG
jgi:NAD(P)-dependent dehydrogenase (short-subunit alcohol dehydrogenase family)